MRKILCICLLAITLALCFCHPLSAATPTEVEPLPDIILPTPENPDHIKYLGLKSKAGDPFKISDIKADIVMIELFSMYCPYCQNAAPIVNELHELMELKNTPEQKLVIIGIGANNTVLEVDTFRKGFDIKFPLFSDPDLSIYETLAGEGTPTFIGCKMEEDSWHIFLRKSGGFRNASLFLKDLLKRSETK